MSESSQDNRAFKESLKATSLFGGVQLYNILIKIVQSKFVAIVLGTTGMGIQGLYNSTIDFISACTNLGLSTSAVKDISEANKSGDEKRISLVIGVFRRLVWITGVLGTVCCIALSPLLSKWTFGNANYTLGFILLSCSILFKQLTSCQSALLQGLRKYSYLAKANLLGNTIGLAISVPLYYVFKLKAIVPALIISSIVSFILTWIFSRKIKVTPIHINSSDINNIGKGMIKMGFFVSLSSLLSLASSYIVRAYISHLGGVGQVGLFTAGFSLVNSYVGLVFSAMGTDYYPRLAASQNDQCQFNSIVNNQMQVALLILAPIITVFIVFIQFIVTILYSDKFLPIQGMIYWAIFAIYFKAIGWSLGFTFLAKGESKPFFFNEIVSIIYTTALNILFYKYLGLTGMGISFLVSYFLYAIQCYCVCHLRYGFSIDKSTVIIFFIQLILSLLCILLVLYSSATIRYFVGSVVICLSLFISLRVLNKRINLLDTIKNKFNHNHE